jgi:REP element-mobilizing transposase RayT
MISPPMSTSIRLSKQKSKPGPKPRQLRLISRDQVQEGPFGGSLLKNSHAKTKRPFAPRARLHVTLKTKGYGRLLSWGRRARIESIVTAIAKTNRVEIVKFANVGNHLHLLLSCREKERLTGFLRGISGAIARLVTVDELKRKIPNASHTSEAQSKKADSAGGRGDGGNTEKPRFWVQRPWSRIVAWSGRDFLTASRYVDLNAIESWGHSRQQAILKWERLREATQPSRSG